MMVGKMLMLVSICDSAFGNIGWDEGEALTVRTVISNDVEDRLIDVGDRFDPNQSPTSSVRANVNLSQTIS